MVPADRQYTYNCVHFGSPILLQHVHKDRSIMKLIFLIVLEKMTDLQS